MPEQMELGVGTAVSGLSRLCSIRVDFWSHRAPDDFEWVQMDTFRDRI